MNNDGGESMCIACIASVLPSIIEAIDDDYSTLEMLELVLGTY